MLNCKGSNRDTIFTGKTEPFLSIMVCIYVMKYFLLFSTQHYNCKVVTVVFALSFVRSGPSTHTHPPHSSPSFVLAATLMAME